MRTSFVFALLLSAFGGFAQEGPPTAAQIRKAIAGQIIEFVDIPDKDHLGGFWTSAHPEAQRAMDAVVLFLQQR